MKRKRKENFVMSKTVSIIVPVYNVEKYIYECVDSLLNQTYRDIEIILVDDASPDACPSICDEYALKDTRIKVIHKENGGLSDARNAGLDIATGDYVLFVDSDDYLDLDFYERLYDNAKIYNADIAIGGIKIIDAASNKLGKQCVYNGECEYLTEKILPKIKEGVCWDKIYKSSFLKSNKNIRFPENIVYAEDILFSYLALSNCHKVVFTSGSFYYWMRRGSSISFATNDEKRSHDTLNVLYSIYDELIKNNASQDLAGISLNFAIPYLALFAFKDPKNKEHFNECLQKHYPFLKVL